jgi:hypothetical protein
VRDPLGEHEAVAAPGHGHNYIRDDLAGQNIQGKLTMGPLLI